MSFIDSRRHADSFRGQEVIWDGDGAQVFLQPEESEGAHDLPVFCQIAMFASSENEPDSVALIVHILVGA
jgi:hypothetical protein